MRKRKVANGANADGAEMYHISIVAEMVTTHPQTLRMYERMGLVSPQRTANNVRLYSSEDVERVRRIQHLTQDLGVNLAGVEVVFKLLNELERTRAQSDAMLDALEKSHAEGWSRAELRRQDEEHDSMSAIVPLRIALGEGQTAKKEPRKRK
jgi:MerR family transcriptional regulator/heat shock protein HspR